jgi:hypothetical protein
LSVRHFNYLFNPLRDVACERYMGCYAALHNGGALCRRGLI